MSKKNNRKRKKGRPTREEQLQIHRRIRRYYNRNLKIEEVHRITGYNPKTISTCFNELTEQLEKSETADDIERIKKEMQRANRCYEDMIDETYETLDNIIADIEKYRKENNLVVLNFLSKKLDTIRLIATLNEKINSLQTQLNFSDIIDKMIQKKLEKILEKLKKYYESVSKK